MPEGRKRLVQATKSMLSGKQDKPRLFPAVLGAYVDGVKQIKVQPRPDFVWCRMRGSTSEVVQAFNDSVSLHWDLPVLVFRDPLSPGIWKVYGRDIAQYDDWEGASYLPPHADAHSFGGSPNMGSDPVWVFKRQYMPLLPRPVVSGTLSIFIEPDFWYYQGRYYWWPGSGTTSLAPYMPTGALNGVFVTVYMDGPKKIPQYLKGTEFAAWYPPGDAAEYITLPTPAQGPPLAAVFLTTGTAWIGWGEIYDLRSPAQPLGSLTASGSFIAHDEGLLLGSVTHINFTGAGVSASISGSYVTVNVPSIMPGGLVGQDEGIPVGTGTILNVVGKAAKLTVSGSVIQVSISGTTLQDDGVDKGFFDTVDFVGAGVVASVVGTKATVAILSTPPVSGSFVIEEEGTILGSATELNFIGPTVTAVLVGPRANITVGATLPPVSGSIVVDDESVIQGSALELNFMGDGVNATLVGTRANIIIPGGGGTGTAYRLEVGLALPVSGDYYRVPDPPYVTGSLVIFLDGLAQRPGTDYLEDNASSGTYQYLVTPPTGSFHLAAWDRPVEGGAFVSGSVAVWDEVTPLGSADILAFVGAGVTAAMTAGKATITIPGTVNPPVSGSFVIEEEGAVLGSAIELNFIGVGVTAVLAGTRADITVAGAGGMPSYKVLKNKNFI